MSFRTNIIAGAAILALSGSGLAGAALASIPSSPAEKAECKAANEQQLEMQSEQLTGNAEARAAYETDVAVHAEKLEAWRAANMASEQADLSYKQAKASYDRAYAKWVENNPGTH